MNGNKFATGKILRKPVEVVKGRIWAGWAQKSPQPRTGLISIVTHNHNLQNCLSESVENILSDVEWWCMSCSNGAIE